MDKEITLKIKAKTTAGVRTGIFSKTVLFFEKVLRLEIVHFDQEAEFAQFKLPSGQMMEVFGPKNIWHPFTTPPDWEVIVADIRYRQEKSKS